MHHGAALQHRLPFKRMAPRPKYVSAFTRGNDLPRNTGNTIELVRCKMSYQLFCHKQAEPATQVGRSWPWRASQLSFPCLKAGASAGFFAREALGRPDAAHLTLILRRAGPRLQAWG